MKKILQYLKPYRFRMSVGFLIKFTGTIMDLLLPWILATMLDDVVPAEDIPQVILWGILMVFCSIAALVTNVIANRMASRVAKDSTEKIRHDLFAKITYLSLRQIDTIGIPSLEARMTADTYHVHQMIDRIQRLGVRAPILLVGGIILTFSLDVMLTWILVGVLFFVAALVITISRRGVPLYAQLQSTVDRMIRKVRETVSGIRVVKALSKTEHEKDHFDEVNSEVIQKETTASVAMAITNPLMNMLLNIGLILVLIVGAYRVHGGQTGTGTIIAFLSYFTIILNAMLSVNRMFLLFSKGSASAGRISEILDLPEDFDVTTASTPAQQSARATAMQKSGTAPDEHIAFEHVSFSYLGKKDNIADISFTLKKGESLGIIGPTGCGKSTIINLMLRFYDVGSGVIRIDGVPVESIPFEVLYHKFGIVFQNDVILSETLAENIAFGRELSLEEIRKAAGFAQAEEFISDYMYEASSGGTNLSGGQKQRLLIARALAANPEILVLDDSSSALDYLTDARLRETLREHFAGTTTVIIAQRISSIRHTDRILVLDDGRTVGYGSHESLLESCEPYRKLHLMQLNDA